MKALNKNNLSEKDGHVSKLREKFDALSEAVEKFNEAHMEEYYLLMDAINKHNDKVSELFAEVEEAVDEYNSAVEDAEQFRTDITSEMEDYRADRSEKWQESDAGQQYQEWVSAWEEELRVIEISRPDPIDADEPEALSLDDFEDAAESLENYPDSASGN